jgi:N-sulfoglucosamine sulfohydrolase
VLALAGVEIPAHLQGRVNDHGLINEAEMIQRMWPGRVQPETAQPYIVPRRETAMPVRQPTLKIDAPTEIVMYVPTQERRSATRPMTVQMRRRLYTGPILVDAPATIRAKAIRYGYKESAESRVVFTK